MYTVAIVEDEKITLDELLLTIDWKKLGLEVIGTAENGIQGEELIKRESPDIVLTDIRLPGQDGLEMLSHSPVDYAVILSGHTDFKYTKRAIQLGVVDYLEKPVDDDELINLLKRIVFDLNQEEKLKSSGNSINIVNLPEEINNHIVSLSIEYIKAHYSERIGLGDIAEYTRTSENHLSSIFRETTGINFLQYLNGYRINKSAELLKTTSLNIAEVADACGFPTPSYFTKMFKRFSSLTPREFRDSAPQEKA